MKKLSKFSILFFILCIFFQTSCTTTSHESHSTVQNTQIQFEQEAPFQQGTLDNGMSYVIRENGEPKNRIQLRLVVKAGSCMEDDDQKGVAHFVEHLCFNGTEHFKKSAIVDYFESIGMKYGPEINAYTDYEQTVYMMEIPADNPEILRTSLMILRDWACAVSFEEDAIEKERGIITEEWRYRTQTLAGRMVNFETPVYLRGSRFEKRPVLGDMNIIKKVSRKRIIDFYKKWYRPEFMSVIAIGDIKANVLEDAVKDIMKTVPASKDKIKLPEYTVPLPPKKTIDIMRDKEITIDEIYIVMRKSNNLRVEDDYAWVYFRDIFNLRCFEKTNALNSEWINAKIGTRTETNKTSFYFMQINPKKGRFTEGFKTFLEELDLFLKSGPTESELAREKESLKLLLSQNYKNMENYSSKSFTNNMVNHTVSGSSVLSPNDENFKAELDVVNKMTVEKVRNFALKYFGDRGTTMLLFTPENNKLPSESEIMDVWKNYKGQSKSMQEAVPSSSAEDYTLMAKPQKKAKIKETKKIKEVGATQYTFENGIKCLFKKTDFKNDFIVLYAVSMGGYFQHDGQEKPSASASREYAVFSGAGGKTNAQITKVVQGKRMQVGIGMDRTMAYFDATSNSENIEQTLQLINMNIRAPQFTDEAWKQVMDDFKQSAAGYGSKASQIYEEKINDLLYGKSPYYAPINNEFLSKMNQKDAERIYRERFSDADSFYFIFVGDFDEKKLLDLCAYYIGTLETDGKYDEPNWVHIPFPTKSQTITVSKGDDKMGNIYMCFGGELQEEKDAEKNFMESQIIRQLADYLNIRLREVIREEKSGTYTINTTGNISGWPEREYKVDISFTCEPKRLGELRQEVIKTINEMKAGKISEDIIVKLRESFIREIESSVRDNYWWGNRLLSEVWSQTEPIWFTKDYKKIAAEWITRENILEAANKYLDTNRVVTAYLKPEH